MSDTTFQLDPHSVKRYVSLRDEAIAHALAASERAFPEVYARFGAKGREACAEDLGFHLDFLQPTLETGEISPFLAYLGWLAQVLSSRGVPLRSVEQSLDDLVEFFDDRLGEHAAPVVATLTAGKAALQRGVVTPTYDRPCPAPHDETIPYAGAALQGRHQAAMALLEGALGREQSLPQVAVHVIQPAMYEVGRRWQNNSVSAAQERLATALSQTWMARARSRATAAPDNGLRALFACMAGNHHTLGLRMVADAFELDGWSTSYLGANASLADLVAKVHEIRPQLVGLSASLPQHLRGLREAVQALRAAMREDCPRIVVGGLVFNQFPQLAPWAGAESLGADAVTAAAAAVQAHERGR
ncbi:cobalamin B12-binding domain-containing protein [Paucibacter sp. O1-1]|nr:cobalamin B12-binding domain-containing protein [Paucibacter sp. O1-1]MDA3831238.1 cobalamin B12-binding domain-containing protein [Paucibacter sp. O1-1]